MLQQCCFCTPPLYVHAHVCICNYHPADADLLCTAGKGNSVRKQQEVNDLQVNNEALLCMLERERQHSQRLTEALQQAEANALEVSLVYLLRGTEPQGFLIL